MVSLSFFFPIYPLISSPHMGEPLYIQTLLLYPVYLLRTGESGGGLLYFFTGLLPVVIGRLRLRQEKFKCVIHPKPMATVKDTVCLHVEEALYLSTPLRKNMPRSATFFNFWTVSFIPPGSWLAPPWSPSLERPLPLRLPHLVLRRIRSGAYFAGAETALFDYVADEGAWWGAGGVSVAVFLEERLSSAGRRVLNVFAGGC